MEEWRWRAGNLAVQLGRDVKTDICYCDHGVASAKDGVRLCCTSVKGKVVTNQHVSCAKRCIIQQLRSSTKASVVCEFRAQTRPCPGVLIALLTAVDDKLSCSSHLVKHRALPKAVLSPPHLQEALTVPPKSNSLQEVVELFNIQTFQSTFLDLHQDRLPT